LLFSKKEKEKESDFLNFEQELKGTRIKRQQFHSLFDETIKQFFRLLNIHCILVVVFY